MAHHRGHLQVFDIEKHDGYGYPIIFDADKAKQATEEIMKTFNIPDNCSKDLKAVATTALP